MVGNFYPLEFVFTQYFVNNKSNIKDVNINKILNKMRGEYFMGFTYMFNGRFFGLKLLPNTARPRGTLISVPKIFSVSQNSVS